MLAAQRLQANKGWYKIYILMVSNSFNYTLQTAYRSLILEACENEREA